MTDTTHKPIPSPAPANPSIPSKPASVPASTNTPAPKPESVTAEKHVPVK